METTENGATTKSSNEILTELFGAFNAEPPIIPTNTKRKRESEESDSKHSKRSKKSKKSKKKHKSKHKKKRHSECEDVSESGSVKKKKKTREKKSKKNHVASHSVNIELPVNKVPMALEIMLDGTVGIKGEDGVVTKIPDVCDSHKNGSDSEAQSNVNCCELDNTSSEMIGNGSDEGHTKETNVNKTEDPIKTNPVPKSNVPEVFDNKTSEPVLMPKKGKIQIKDLKHSSVFQETVKAAEELKKKEEGELSNSSEEENDIVELRKSKENEHSRCRHERKSRHHHSREHSKKKRSSEFRSRSRSPSRHHSHEHHRKRNRSRSREYSHHHSHKHSSSRSCHSRSHISHRSRSRSKSRSRLKDSRRHPDEKPKERSEPEEKIDKEKLLAIARKNALKLIDAGVVPGAEKLTAIKAGGKTVNELTEYCKKLSEKEALGDDLSDILSESSEDEEKPFHHPFQVKDRPSSIVMNIKNSIPLPVKSLQEKAAEQAKQLRLQFPVSSGTSHRRNESEWVPVSPKKESVAQPPQKMAAVPVPPPVAPPVPVDNHALLPPPQPPMPFFMSSIPPPQPPNRPMFPVIPTNIPPPTLDISSIVSKRLEAIRKLQENPNDSHALTQMYSAQQEMQHWAESKQETGAFTGHTGVKVLSPSELNLGAHAWAKRDQLMSATPVRGGMGMTLLQKMGWQPGEGLGKNKEGTLEPLKLEIKTDKKGLLAPDESCKGKRGYNIQHPGPPLPTVKNLEGKHPVSLLNELCSRRKYGIPQFELCFECGPDHKKNFLFKVRVNGIEYTPSVASPNKKQAKAEAAAICLRALGIIPSEPPQNRNF